MKAKIEGFELEGNGIELSEFMKSFLNKEKPKEKKIKIVNEFNLKKRAFLNYKDILGCNLKTYFLKNQTKGIDVIANEVYNMAIAKGYSMRVRRRILETLTSYLQRQKTNQNKPLYLVNY